MEEMEEKKVNEVIKRNRSFSNNLQTRPSHRYGKNRSFGGTTDALTSDLSQTLDSAVDLDWDKSNDFQRMIESDHMSVYDLNEQMTELIRLKLLEFEELSASCSMKSFQHLSQNRKGSMFDDDLETDNDLDMTEFDLEPQKRNRLRSKRTRNLTNSSIVSNEFTPADCLTMEDLFRCKLLSLEQNLKASLSTLNIHTPSNKLFNPLTFEMEYANMNMKNVNSKMTPESRNLKFYHSMPDLRVFASSQMSLASTNTFKSIKMGCKHSSLMDIRSFQWIYIKRETVDRIGLIKSLKLDLKPSYSNSAPLPTSTTAENANILSPNSVKEEASAALPNMSGMAINFSRMSKLTMLRSYITKFGDKVKQILAEVFSNSDLNQQANTVSTQSNVPNYAFNAKTNNLYSINEETVETYDVIENPQADSDSARSSITTLDSVIPKQDTLVLEKQDSSKA